jgi:Domain of unknown function (DUF1996)
MAAAVAAVLVGCSSDARDVADDVRETAVSSVVAPVWEGIRYPSVGFVVTCRASHELPDDPIVHPGHPGASHLHAFFGNRSTSGLSTYREMVLTPSTCSDPLDRSGYWTPAPAGDVLRAYYDAGDADPGLLVAPPRDVRVIAGRPDVEQPVGAAVVGFRCGQLIDGPGRGEWASTPPTSGGCTKPGAINLVRYTFRQCVEVERNGTCAEGSPMMPRLRLVMEWKGPPKTAAGSPAIAPHADFWNTWNQARLEELTAICVRGERTTNLAVKQCGLPGAT